MIINYHEISYDKLSSMITVMEETTTYNTYIVAIAIGYAEQLVRVMHWAIRK